VQILTPAAVLQWRLPRHSPPPSFKQASVLALLY
jgi:hypothetical protein